MFSSVFWQRRISAGLCRWKELLRSLTLLKPKLWTTSLLKGQTVNREDSDSSDWDLQEQTQSSDELWRPHPQPNLVNSKMHLSPVYKSHLFVRFPEFKDTTCCVVTTRPSICVSFCDSGLWGFSVKVKSCACWEDRVCLFGSCYVQMALPHSVSVIKLFGCVQISRHSLVRLCPRDCSGSPPERPSWRSWRRRWTAPPPSWRSSTPTRTLWLVMSQTTGLNVNSIVG